MNWDLFRLIIGVVFLLAGLLTFAAEVFGVFRYKFVLNRMHAAAMGDTFGLVLSMLGLIILSGLNFTSLKMALVVLFLWFSSPVSSHLIARLEVMTDETLGEHCDIKDIREENGE